MSSLTGSPCITAFYAVFTFCLSFGLCSNGAACGSSVSPEQCGFSDSLLQLLSLAALDLGPSFNTVSETPHAAKLSQGAGLLGLFQQEETVCSLARSSLGF